MLSSAYIISYTRSDGLECFVTTYFFYYCFGLDIKSSGHRVCPVLQKFLNGFKACAWASALVQVQSHKCRKIAAMILFCKLLSLTIMLLADWLFELVRKWCMEEKLNFYRYPLRCLHCTQTLFSDICEFQSMHRYRWTLFSFISLKDVAGKDIWLDV